MALPRPPKIEIPLAQRQAHPGAGPVAAPEAGHGRVRQHVAQASEALQAQRSAIPDAIARPLTPTPKHDGHLPAPDMVLPQRKAEGHCVPGGPKQHRPQGK